jgi:hypothetical protein
VPEASSLIKRGKACKGTTVTDSSVPAGDTAPVAPLENAAREVFKGTLVPLKGSTRRGDSHGLVKYAAVRQLALAPGDTDSVRRHLESAGPPNTRVRQAERITSSTLELLQSFEQPVVAALRPGIATVAAIPPNELTTFANTVVAVREARVAAARGGQLSMLAMGEMLGSLNAAVVAARGLEVNSTIQPLGMLNLERIEMVPAGIQRGELIGTIPLAPGEETAVTHKEWSVTSKEFTTIVTDSLEDTSETGVTDNTDLSQATTSQNQHSIQFNITGTVQGGIPMINGSSSAGVTAQDSGSQSATDSIKHATTVTRKAASRSRQEHKTTISTKTVTGTSETSTRILKNTSSTDPIRIDYFSLMRKWRVRLYRFGLRLTYDMVVPEPAAAMRRAYVELEMLRNRLGPFVFNEKLSDIAPDVVDKNWNPAAPGPSAKAKYLWLSDKYGVAVKPYPDTPSPLFPSVRGDGNRDWSYLDLPFNVPQGAMIREVRVSTNIGANSDFVNFKVLGARMEGDWLDKDGLFLLDAKVTAAAGNDFFMKDATGEQKVSFWIDNSAAIWIGLKIVLANAPAAIEQWQTEVWNTLYNAAQTRYYSQQQDIAQRIVAIEERLSNVDTLTLRREESDEMMKSVLKFALGADFDFMPASVHQAFEAGGVDFRHGVSFDGPKLGLSTEQWSVLRQHEDVVRFINQAIEWENVVTFLYSYFWDVPDSWAFIRDLRHPDATRQAFLRAGSARVVLTVRKGWEAKWLRFTQDGTIDGDEAAPTTGPYLSIAQEIAAYDDRNYPGIPPANPARAATRLQDAVFTTSAAKIVPGANGVVIPVASSEDFVVGLPVILDSEDDRHVQESAVITDVPDATHITVDGVVHVHDGTETPFAVLQPGDKGALIAEWNEYTPSSGTDIALTSNLATIA